MKTSPTGKPLCYHKHCRKLATHAVGFYRSQGQPAHLYACEAHTERWNDARRLDMPYSENAPFLAELPVIEDQAAPSEPEQLAQFFHETYERLAPSFGYQTREESAVSWSHVPENNKQLMIAVAAQVLASRFCKQVEPLPVIMLDAMVHTDERPTCSDNTCPCQDASGYYQKSANHLPEPLPSMYIED